MLLLCEPVLIRREVLRLAKDEQLIYKQIADKLSLSPLTVETYMQHALQQLRDYLHDNSVVRYVYNG